MKTVRVRFVDGVGAVIRDEVILVASAGLQAGDVVVTAGQLKLHDGAAVRVIEADGLAPGERKVS